MKILIVGLGSMGKRRARLLKGIDPSIQISVVDNTEFRRAEAAGLGMTAYPSIKEACECETFDAALVCTAPLSHAVIIKQLLEQGLSIFTELNLVKDGYEDAIALAKEKGLSLFLSSTMLYRGEIQYIANKVKEFDKKVNYIYHIGQYLPDWHPWENYRNFFVGNKRTGGVREIFGIELPWLTETFGDVVSFHVEKDKISELEVDYEDSIFVTLRHASGAKGVLAVDVVSPKAVRNLEVFGEGLHLFWEGNPKALYQYDADKQEKVAVNTYTTYEHDNRYSDNIVENAYVDELSNFLAVLKGEQQPRYSFEKDLKIIDLMDKIEGAE